MSFKRDGDDRYALENLRKRRVSDLLYEDIQDGEVSKLRNGRYLCKMCPHCPTFDTLNMFQVHKQGKKHKHSLEYKEIERQELQNLIEKRQHEHMVSNRDSSLIQIPDSTSATDSVKPAPYDPRSKRHKVKPYSRRTVLDLGQNHNDQHTVETTALETLPGYSDITGDQRRPRNAESAEKADRIFVNTRSTNLFTQAKKDYYDSKPTGTPNSFPHKRDKQEDGEIVNSKNVSKFIDPTKSETISKHYFARKQKVCISKSPDEIVSRPHVQQDFTKSWDYFKVKPVSKAVVVEKKSKPQEPVKDTKDSGYNKDGAQSEVSRNPGTSQTVSNPETKERAEKMLRAFGSGWKKDWSGKWIKDEDVEFDSDEEPPDIN